MPRGTFKTKNSEKRDDMSKEEKAMRGSGHPYSSNSSAELANRVLLWTVHTK